jgi:hypothetical protein
MDDFEAHLEICDTLRQINEDDHDLHSGRFFRGVEVSVPVSHVDNEVVILRTGVMEFAEEAAGV